MMMIHSVVAAEQLRIVSLSPSITEIIYILGRGDLLVGRSSACDFPLEAKQLKIAGNFGTPFLEHIAALHPNYVITTKLKDQSYKHAIEQLGAKLIFLPDNNFDDYLSCVKSLGEVLNCQAAAQKEADRFKNALLKFKSEAEQIPINQRPKIYIEVWSRPLLTCGGNTFINNMIEYAGGVNIGRNEKAEYYNCSQEWILNENPDVIICPAMGSGMSAEIGQRRGWNEINAVKHQRVFTGIEQDKLYRLGPRTIEGIAIIQKCINAKNNELN
jgi:iron complex transport system substrate-binding protein